ncbi:S-layer homology domain-containing protein [Ammoniphilus sp. YIM 78166]|uniref:S-layer homology domain-containing protein n=1 Tax=Ammoniphilus sp. YIM 78166 TaxID=1644106 RepID=UPI00142F899E|nr:S-layer homology domain-containing protein [Ammoniphilus sp. YIM 78166]
MKKQVIQCVLATSLLASTLSPVTVAASVISFSDTEGIDSEKIESIAKAVELGIFSGDANGRFRPNDRLTRQELAVLLTRLLDLQLEKGPSSFRDVRETMWGQPFIEAVKKAGIMVGDGKQTFRPTDYITREELAVLLVRMVEEKTKELRQASVTDHQAISSWAKGAVQTAVDAGVMKLKDQRFHPKQTVQRQEAAEIFVQAYELLQRPAILEQIKDNRVTISGVTYEFTERVKALFDPRNAAILEGANIRIGLLDGKIDQIKYLEIKSGGQAAQPPEREFARNLLLDGQGVMIEGDLKIAADFISVKDLTIKGDLVITPGLEQDFYSERLQVHGKTYINGGDSNTVVFQNAMLGQVEVNKPEVRVEALGGSLVGELVINTNTVIVGDASSVIPKVSIQDGANRVELNASIDQLMITSATGTEIKGDATINTVSVQTSSPVALNTSGQVGNLAVVDSKASLTLGTDTKVDNLTLPQGVTAQNVVSNFSTVAQQISQVNGTTATAAPTSSSSSNSAPVVVNKIPNQLVQFGDGKFTIDLTGVFEDPEDLPIARYTVRSSRATVATASVSGSILTLTPAAAGVATITVTAVDAAGLSTTTSFTITVNAAPKAGLWTDQILTLGLADPTIDLSTIFTDADADPLTFTADIEHSDIATVVVNGKILTLTPVAAGSTTVTATAADGKGGMGTKSIGVLVNRAPLAAPLADRVLTLESGEDQLELEGLFTDEDGDSLTYTVVTGDSMIATASISGTLLTLTPKAAGTTLVTVTGRDGKGGLVSQSFTLLVNRSPVGAELAEQLIQVGGTEVAVDLSFTDADSDPLILTAHIDDPSVASVRIQGEQLMITPQQGGRTTVTVTAEDGKGGQVQKSFTLEVNRPPVVGTVLTDQFATIGTDLLIALDQTFNDLDGDLLAYEAVSEDEDVVSATIDQNQLMIKGLAAPGEAVVRVTARDGKGGELTQDFKVEVNRAPEVAQPMGNQTALVGAGATSVDLTLAFTDPDNDPLTFSALSANSAIATVAVQNKQLQITPVSGGSTLITVTATDEKGGKISSSFTVDVNEAPRIMNQIGQQILQDGIPDSSVVLDLSEVFSDVNPEDTVTISAESLNDDIATATLIGNELTLLPVTGGVATIKVTADDGRGGKTQLTFDVRVNRAPTVIGTTSEIKVGLDTTRKVNLDQYFTDADGDPLTYDATSMDPDIAVVSVNGSGLEISGIAEGQTVIQVVAMDSSGRTAEGTLDIGVSSNQEPIALESFPEQVVGAGVPSNIISLNGLFSDPDGDPLTYTVSVGDASMVSASITGDTLTLTSNVTAGKTTVTITADDGKGGTATSTVTLHAVQVVEMKQIKTKSGVTNDVIYDLASVLPGKNSFLVYRQTKGSLTHNGVTTLNGTKLQLSPNSGNFGYWVVTDDYRAAFVELMVEPQTGPNVFFTEYLDAGNGRAALEILGIGDDTSGMLTGYELEIHQWRTDINQAKVHTLPLLPFYPNMTCNIIDSTFYDLFDVSNAWYYNNETTLSQPTLVPYALVLKKNGHVLDIIGNTDPVAHKPIFANGGTIVRKQGITTGSTSYSLEGEWDLYPSGTFTFYGRHTP